MHGETASLSRAAMRSSELNSHRSPQRLTCKDRIAVNETSAPMPIIGWREWVSLPDLGVKFTKAKVDTGARSSSLHAFDIETFDKDSEQWVRFKIFPKQRSEGRVVDVEAPVLEHRSIRSSNGKSELRPVILTTCRVLKRTIQVELTLADRRKMGFRMLLGREAIRSNFLVDSGRSFLGGKPKRKKPQ